MTIWDLSDRDAWQRLGGQAAHDAYEDVAEMWPNAMPEDFRAHATSRTRDFLDHSMSIPRWGRQSQEAMRGMYDTIGNSYYWTYLQHFTSAVTEQIHATFRLPRYTTPLPQHQSQQQTSQQIGAPPGDDNRRKEA